jgi:hypothetical protein
MVFCSKTGNLITVKGLLNSSRGLNVKITVDFDQFTGF